MLKVICAGVIATALASAQIIIRNRLDPTRPFPDATASTAPSPAGVSCTVTLGNLLETTVSTAITAAGSGDTICLPAGTGTWSALTISKKLTLQGAGGVSGNTTINCTSAGQSACLAVTASTNAPVKVAGIKFVTSSAPSRALLSVDGPVFDVDAIIMGDLSFDDNSIVTTSYRLLSWGEVFGVFYGGAFIRRNANGGQPIEFYGSNDNTDGGFTPWRTAPQPGTKYAMVVEDTTFSKPNSAIETIDCYGGAIVQFRFNGLTDESIGCHGLDSGRRRSAMWREQYGNAFSRTATGFIKPDEVRGGSQYKFFDTYSGNYATQGFDLHYARASNALVSDPGMQNWKNTDGTNWYLGTTDLSSCGRAESVSTLNGAWSCSTSSGNANVKWCSGSVELECTADSTCSAAGAGTCSRFLDGTGTSGYPGRDQPGYVGGGTNAQTFIPLREWNNGSRHWDVNGNQCTASTFDSSHCPPLLLANGLGYLATWMQQDRDYFQSASGAQNCVSDTACTTPFNGTTGVGWGTRGRRPNTCTTGVGYWATNEGTWNRSTSNPRGVNFAGASGNLYVCTSTNTWTLTYTPVAYPHPLQSWFATTFPLAENPISEGGLWHHTAAELTNVKTETIGGVRVAHGTQVGGPFSPFDDSNAYLSGYAADHAIEGVLYKNGGTDANVQEAELLLRWSDNNAPFDPGGGFGTTTVHGYEINVSRGGGYLNLGQFKGPLLAFANPSPASQIGRAPADGDTFKATIETSGTSAVIKVFWKRIGETSFFQMTLNTGSSLTLASPWTSGNPGIGFYNDSSVPNNQFGFKSVIARNLP